MGKALRQLEKDQVHKRKEEIERAHQIYEGDMIHKFEKEYKQKHDTGKLYLSIMPDKKLVKEKIMLEKKKEEKFLANHLKKEHDADEI